MEANNILRVKGYFPGQPVQINFELLFVPTAGQWRLFGLGVAAVRSNGAATPKAVGPMQKDVPKKANDTRQDAVDSPHRRSIRRPDESYRRLALW